MQLRAKSIRIGAQTDAAAAPAAVKFICAINAHVCY